MIMMMIMFLVRIKEASLVLPDHLRHFNMHILRKRTLARWPSKNYHRLVTLTHSITTLNAAEEVVSMVIE